MQNLGVRILGLFLLIGLTCIIALNGDEVSEDSKSLQTAESETQTKPDSLTKGWQIFEIENTTSLPPRKHAASVYNGKYFYVFSGCEGYYRNEKIVTDCWRYNPKTDIWHEIEVPSFVKGRLDAKMLAIDDKIVIYGGYVDENGEEKYLNNGYVLHTESKKWSEIDENRAPSPRGDFSAIATDKEIIIFGGIDENDKILDSCYSYNPKNDNWSYISTPDELEGRFYHNALWTGEKMLITGGIIKFSTVLENKERFEYDPKTEKSEKKKYQEPVTYNVTTKQSAVYDPKNKTWEVFDLPESRTGHTAVWTGQYALLWGGYSGNETSEEWGHNTIVVAENHNGKMVSYPRTQNIVPSRQNHVAFWTGKDMLVGFGDNPQGDGESPLYRSGGLYDPRFNKWTIPGNCPFTIYIDNYECQTFMDNNHVVYNFSSDPNITGRYLPDKDVFLTGIGSGFQPDTKELMFLDTPDGIYASASYDYRNGRIQTYAFWKFNEKAGKFERIDESRKEIMYGDCTPLWRDDKINFNTSLARPDSLYCKDGFMGIYNENSKNWIKAQTNGVVPIDRYLCTQALNEDYLFVSGGVFEPIIQYVENFDIAWERRTPDKHFSLEHWYKPWFEDQLRISKQSKTYPVLDDAFLYNFKTNTWIPVNMKNAPEPRVSAISCSVGNKFAIFGGFVDDPDYEPFYVKEEFKPKLEDLASIDGGIYDPVTQQWTKIADLHLDKTESSYLFNSYGFQLTSLGNYILLYEKPERWNDWDEEVHEDFLGYVYDTQKQSWHKLDPPCKNAYIIAEVVNINDKVLMKVCIKHSDDNTKWFSYDAANNKWGECAINQILTNDYYNALYDDIMSDMKDETSMHVYGDKVIFYTHAKSPAKDDESGDSNRYTLKIYSYDPVRNEVTKLTEIETDIDELNDGTCLEYSADTVSLNTHYERDRIVFFGYKNLDEDTDDYNNQIGSKMYVLIYNFPENK